MKRNKSYLKVYLFCVFTLALMLNSTTTFGDTIHVPGEYKTIQEAIEAAFTGDTVLVADGTHKGPGNRDLDFSAKAITVQSENGPNNCIIDCEDDGRGFYFHSGEGLDSVVSGFTIINGYVATNGGGIYCYQSSPTITNCIISDNDAEYGGGIYCEGKDSKPTITDCIISDNDAYFMGGGIYCYQSSPTISNCTINGNMALDEGGGIYCYQFSPTITNCTIVNNMAYPNGGGIYCYQSSPTISNCTISYNMAYNEDEGGDGIYCEDSKPIITNCILWGDSPDEIYVESGDPTITYSDVKGGYPGEGNIEADPMFVGGDDYHLTEGSPCIDAGTAEGAPDTDIDGDSRPQGAGYDIGSDEYVGGLEVYEVYVDIKPRSCPNPLYLKSRWFLPVAVLGTEDFDVTKIDAPTVRLSREGNGEGVPPIRWEVKDVSTPLFKGEPCDCHKMGPDGNADLILKFRNREVVEALGEVKVGEEIELTITGLFNGTEFKGKDCVTVTACFIATAAYESHMAKDVEVLGKVRDTYLLKNYLGRALVSFYYEHGPKLANFISKHPFLKSFVRVGLYPWVKASRLVIEKDEDRR